MQHLFLDCSHGMSGDMTLASLAHLGVDLSPLPGLLAQAGVACRLEVWQEERGGGPGCRVEVSWEVEGQPLRHPADIAAIFAAVPVSNRVRHKALAVLEALTLAEAEAHGIAPEEVHFHEVGAVDTLVDILGACWALDQLGVERVTACALPWFGGSITCAHGEIPLPAPATANLMCGLPVYPTDAKTELVTPTGAALARVLVDEFVEGPEGRLLAMGTGYGARPAPTGLRAWLVEAREPRQADHGQGGEEDVMQLECHLDHLTGEELGTALEQLAAAADVLDVLHKVGGLDIAAMTGAFLGCAHEGIAAAVDGYISVVAALCAVHLCPAAADYLFLSHQSYELGYARAAQALGLTPCLALDMRLGEGSGCPLLFRVLEGACGVMKNMATFSEAAIQDDYLEPIRSGDSFTVEKV